MNKFSLTLIFALLLSGATQAMTVVCKGKTSKDTKSLILLRLTKELVVDGILYAGPAEECSPQLHNELTKVCAVKSHTLVIHPKGSVLLTTSGKTINLVCTEEDIVGPTGGVGGSN